MPSVLFILILYREFAMMFLRLTASVRGIPIAARKGGKLKTVFYIVSGFVMLGAESALRLGIDGAYMTVVRTALFILFGACALLSYVSFADYLIHFIPAIQGK